MMDFGRRWLGDKKGSEKDKDKDKDKEKEKDKDKDKDKDKEKEKVERVVSEAKEKEKEKDKEREKSEKEKEIAKLKKERKEEKEREKQEKLERKKENGSKSPKGTVDMGNVDWREARDNLKNRRSTSFSAEQKKTHYNNAAIQSKTYGRNSVSLLDLQALKNSGGAKPDNKGNPDARTTKQKQKIQEKEFLESIAQHQTQNDKPHAFAIASESYKIRIIELEEEVVNANKRVASLSDRVHMLEAEIRAANEHHTRQNATLQAKLANLETDNAVLKNDLATTNSQKLEISEKLAFTQLALSNAVEEEGEGADSGSGAAVPHNGQQDKKEDTVKDTAQKSEVKVDSSEQPKSAIAERVSPLASTSSPKKFPTLTPSMIKQLSMDKDLETELRQRIQVLEGDLSSKTNGLAVLKLQINTLEPQVKTLSQEMNKAKNDASTSGEQVSDVVEILGEWQTAMEAHDADLRELLADESEVPPNEEIRRLNKKLLLLRERLTVVDQIIDRIAKTVGVNSTRLDIGTSNTKTKTPIKDHNIQSLALNPSRQAIRSNSNNERDAALAIKLAALTMGTEPAVQKLIKGIWLNTVRCVNLGGGLIIPTDIIQALSKALQDNATVLSVLFPNTFLGDAGLTLLADAMRGNSSITNLNLEECSVGDAGVKALAQALATNSKAAVTSLNLSHNTIGEVGAQSLALFLEKSTSLTKLDIGYAHLGVASAPFIARALRPTLPLTHLIIPGNNFQDDGAHKIAIAINKNTTLQVLNFQSNNVTDKGAGYFAEALYHCHIQTIDLSRNPIGPLGAKALADALKYTNAHLKELSLISSSILTQGANHLADALEHNTTLTALHLWGNKIGHEGLTTFTQAKRLGGVKILDIRFNNLPASAGNEIATLLAKKSSLSELDLTGNALGPKGCSLIAATLSTAALTALNLSANSVGNDGVMQIARAIGPALSTLSLSLNFLGDDAIDHLAPRLLAPCHVTHLDLSWNHIGSGGARELGKILGQEKCTITTLNLEGNSLGPEGTVLLAASLHSNTTLSHLILASNNFRKDGAKAMADLLKRSSTINTLNINKNGIKDDGAVALADALKTNVAMEHMDLSENRIENAGVRALSEALKLNSSLLSINLSHNPFDRSAVNSLSQAHARNLKVHITIHSM